MIGENTVTRNSHSSVPLQMLIYFSYHYTPFFFFINLCLFTYKGTILSYTVFNFMYSKYKQLPSSLSCPVLLPGKITRLGVNYNILIPLY